MCTSENSRTLDCEVPSNPILQTLSFKPYPSNPILQTLSFINSHLSLQPLPRATTQTFPTLVTSISLCPCKPTALPQCPPYRLLHCYRTVHLTCSYQVITRHRSNAGCTVHWSTHSRSPQPTVPYWPLAQAPLTDHQPRSPSKQNRPTCSIRHRQGSLRSLSDIHLSDIYQRHVLFCHVQSHPRPDSVCPGPK